MSRPKNIKSLKKRPSKANILLYSEPGVMKSSLIAESPNVLILNAGRSDGLEAARRRGLNPDVWDITSMETLYDAFGYLRMEDHGYEWVWLDDGTLFQETHMEEIMIELHKAKPHRDVDLPDKAEYQKEQRAFFTWIRHMTMQKKFNFGITAHVMRIYDEDKDEVRYMPAFQGGQGQMSSKICGTMSVVGRLYVTRKEVNGKKKKVRVLQTEPDSRFYAKDGFNGVLGGRMVNPTMAKITDALFGGK